MQGYYRPSRKIFICADKERPRAGRGHAVSRAHPRLDHCRHGKPPLYTLRTACTRTFLPVRGPCLPPAVAPVH